MSGNLYALLVGIDKYKKIRNLSGCVNDIMAVKNFLDKHLNQETYTFPDSEPMILTDKAATHDAIIKGFKNYLSKAGKGDVVLFYFCGHGAREKAGEEFEGWQLNNVHETIVCHDSLSQSETDHRIIPTLADKELRYLISEIANKEDKPDHILVIFDCCHSSSGTRELVDYEAEGIRQIADIDQAREYSEFCFHDQILKDNLSPETFPQGEHTFIAACLNTETAKEIPLPGVNVKRGLFTYFLIKELESQDLALSYEDLMHEVRTRVTGIRLYQNPQLEFVRGGDSKKPSSIHLENSEAKTEPLRFLGNPASIKSRDPFFALSYRPSVEATGNDPEQQAEWIINAGAFQGIQQGIKLAVYPEGSKYENFEPSGSNEVKPVFVKDGSEEEAIAQLEITEVRASESIVKFDWGTLPPHAKDNHTQFPAVVIKRPLPKVQFYFEGKKAADRELLEKVRKTLLEEWRSLVVGVVGDHRQAHHYCLYIRDQQFEIRDGIDDRILIEPFPAEDNDSSIALAANRVEHIAKWITTRDLENPNSVIDKDGIKIEVTYQGVTSQKPHLVLHQQAEKPRINLKIKNKSGQRLFFTLLDICSDYSVAYPKILYDGENESQWLAIESGDTYTAKYRDRQNKLREDIPIGIPTKYETLTEYGETLKLIASTYPFAVDQFRLNPLPMPSSERSIGDDEVPPPPIGDWVTKQFDFTFIRSKSSVDITSNAQTQLSSGVSVQVPVGFSATASLKPVATVSGERSLGPDVELPQLKDAEVFDLIDRRWSDRSISQIPSQQLSLLELSGNGLAIDTVTPESPIVISSNRPLEPTEGVLALAHDGKFWLPVGYALPKNGHKTDIEIQHLVTRGRDDVQDGERKISEAISLCFLKVALRQKQTAWLRQATLSTNGTVSFTPRGDLESVRKAVAQAERIVLFIHGILGDTESMIPSLQAAELLERDSREQGYDLVLAFDYESLNTKIQDTATNLKDQLNRVGLRDGHTKTLHIIAHSMGGLVSRCFIEQQDGNKVVNHLIMLGTPNGGSEWSSVYQLATLLLSAGLNFIPQSFVAGPIVSLLAERSLEKMSTTLDQMNIQESELLAELRHSTDPQCPYTIIAGDTQLSQGVNAEATNLLKALKQKVWKGLEIPFRNQSNDIAVTVESIFTRNIFDGRSPKVNFIEPIACNHLVYFKEQSGLKAIEEAVRQALGSSVKLEDLSVKRELSKPDALPGENPFPALNTLTQPSIQPQIMFASQASKAPSQTSTTLWFDTTHVVGIGIDAYTNGVPSLAKAANDALAVARIIKDLNPTETVKYYFSVGPTGTNASEIEQKIKEFGGTTFPPTKEAFDRFLCNLKATVKKNDRIILYFAGHGVALPFKRVSVEKSDSKSTQQLNVDNKPQGYLLFQDAVKGKSHTYLDMEKLVEHLREIECRHGLVILDCCFAGAIEWAILRDGTRQVGDDEITPSVLDRYITKDAWQFLTSSSEGQKTNEILSINEQLEKNHSGNSPFATALRKVLIDGEADALQLERGFVYANQLINYLREQVEGAAAEVDKQQTPCIFPFTLKHEQTAEFVFLLDGKNLSRVKADLEKTNPDPKIEDMKNPYLGLESYSPQDSDLFFGRERPREQLINLVNFGLQPEDLRAEGLRPEDLIKQLENLIHSGSEDLIKQLKNFVHPGLETIRRQDLIKRLHELGRENFIRMVKKLIHSGSEDLIKQLEGFERKDLENLLDKHTNKFPLVVVSGSSGSGKSSLVKAGLIPRMFPQHGDSQQRHKGWEVFRPGRSPVNNLEQALKNLQVDSLLEGEKRILIGDQIEEVETQCEDPEQKRIFWEELIKLLKGRKVDVVLTLRSDFETTLRGQFEAALKSEKIELPNCWVSAKFTVPPMEREDLEAVITGSAAKYKVFFEDKKNDNGATLVGQLSREVTGMPGALPLLSVALNSMYKNFNERYLKGLNAGKPIKREITWDDYQSLEGGVPGALRRKATEEFNNLKYEFDTNNKKILPTKEVTCDVAEGRRKMLRWAMMRMLTRKGTEIARRQVLESELVYDEDRKNRWSKDALQRFASPEVRLLVRGGEGTDIYYEPAHDALVREWDYIKAWLEGKEKPVNIAPQESASEEEDREESPNLKTQSEFGFFGKLLSSLKSLKNWFSSFSGSTDQTSQPFDLNLLQDLSVAAKTWDTWKRSSSPDGVGKPPGTTNKE